MTIYHGFAELYRRGWYANFSLNIALVIPALLEHLHCQPGSTLDLACGMGDFAIEMAKQGLKTTGVDLSTRMLAIAKQKARREKVNIEWLHQDMRDLNVSKKVDLCTCWFDSLNYILDWRDLKQVFRNVYQALNSNGYFLFDMNTRHGLIERWNRFPCYVPQDSPSHVEVHQPSFDHEQNIASMKITGFIKEDGRWKRIQEIHKEKAYSLQEIRDAFMEAGFNEIHSFGSLEDRTPIDSHTGRAFFILQNKQV